MRPEITCPRLWLVSWILRAVLMCGLSAESDSTRPFGQGNIDMGTCIVGSVPAWSEQLHAGDNIAYTMPEDHPLAAPGPWPLREMLPQRMSWYPQAETRCVPLPAYWPSLDRAVKSWRGRSFVFLPLSVGSH